MSVSTGQHTQKKRVAPVRLVSEIHYSLGAPIRFVRSFPPKLTTQHRRLAQMTKPQQATHDDSATKSCTTAAGLKHFTHARTVHTPMELGFVELPTAPC